MSILKTITFPTILNDVYFCSTEDAGYLAVAANAGPGGAKVQPGSVTIFSRYVRGLESDVESLKELAKFTVGESWPLLDRQHGLYCKVLLATCGRCCGQPGMLHIEPVNSRAEKCVGCRDSEISRQLAAWLGQAGWPVKVTV
jgi:hypothetical protein